MVINTAGISNKTSRPSE